MRRSIRAAAAVLTLALAPGGLAACSPKAEATAPTSSPAATVPAASADGAEAFVRSLYSTETGGTGTSDDTRPWSARTAALIAESETLTAEGDQGYFDADPFCACQDDGGMMLRSVAVTSTGPETANAAVVMEWTLSQPIGTIRQTFNLVREGGAWKIDDIQRDQSLEFPQAPIVQDINRYIAETRAANA